MGAAAFEYFARAFGLRGVNGVDGNEDVPFFDFAFVAARFVFGNAHANQRASDAADGCAHRSGAERGHNRARGEERTDARNGESADSREPAQGAGEDATGARTSRSAFGGLSVAFVGEILNSSLIGSERGNLVVRNPRGLEAV